MAETEVLNKNVPENVSDEVADNGENSASYFTNLPIGQLICTPFIELARGQAQLCEVYIQTLYKLAYVDPDKAADGSDNSTREIKFSYQRSIVDKDTGSITVKDFVINAPLVSLVPIPAFTLDTADVNFNMEVNIANSQTDTTTSSLDTNVSFGFWKIKGNIEGKISNESTVTSTSSNKATYTIAAHAVQQGPTEGMAKLTALLAETMEPISLS